MARKRGRGGRKGRGGQGRSTRSAQRSGAGVQCSVSDTSLEDHSAHQLHFSPQEGNEGSSSECPSPDFLGFLSSSDELAENPPNSLLQNEGKCSEVSIQSEFVPTDKMHSLNVQHSEDNSRAEANLSDELDSKDTEGDESHYSNSSSTDFTKEYDYVQKSSRKNEIIVLSDVAGTDDSQNMREPNMDETSEGTETEDDSTENLRSLHAGDEIQIVNKMFYEYQVNSPDISNISGEKSKDSTDEENKVTDPNGQEISYTSAYSPVKQNSGCTIKSGVVEDSKIDVQNTAKELVETENGENSSSQTGSNHSIGTTHVTVVSIRDAFAVQNDETHSWFQRSGEKLKASKEVTTVSTLLVEKCHGSSDMESFEHSKGEAKKLPIENVNQMLSQEHSFQDDNQLAIHTKDFSSQKIPLQTKEQECTSITHSSTLEKIGSMATTDITDDIVGNETGLDSDGTSPDMAHPCFHSSRTPEHECQIENNVAKEGLKAISDDGITLSLSKIDSCGKTPMINIIQKKNACESKYGGTNIHIKNNDVKEGISTLLADDIADVTLHDEVEETLGKIPNNIPALNSAELEDITISCDTKNILSMTDMKESQQPSEVQKDIGDMPSGVPNLEITQHFYPNIRQKQSKTKFISLERTSHDSKSESCDNPLTNMLLHGSADKLQQQSGDELQEQSTDELQQRSGDQLQEQSTDELQHQSIDELQQQQSGDKLQKQSGDELQQQSGDKLQQQSGDELQQQSGDELQQQSGDELQQQSGDELQQQSGDELQQQSGDELQQQSANELQQQSANELQQQSGDELQQQSGDELQQQLGDELQQQSGYELQQQSIDELQQQQSGDELQQQQSVDELQQQQSGDKLQKQSGDELQQQSGDELQQQSGDELQQQQSVDELQQQQSVDKLQQQQSVDELQQQQSADELEQQSGDELQEQSTDELQEQSTDELQEQSTDELQQQSTDELQCQSGDELQQQSGDELQKQSVDKLKQQSGDELQQQSGYELQQQSGDELQQQSTDELQQQSADSLQQQSADNLQQQAGDELQQQSADELQLQFVDKLQNQSTDELKNQSTDELKNQSVDELKNQSVDELKRPSADKLKIKLADELQKQSTNEIHQQSTNDLHHKSADELLKQFADKLVQQSADELPQHSTDKLQHQCVGELQHQLADLEQKSVKKPQTKSDKSIASKPNITQKKLAEEFQLSSPSSTREKKSSNLAGAAVNTKMKKPAPKYGEEHILVTVERNVPPANGKHECVLCVPGRGFHAKQLVQHMRSLTHLKNVLELVDIAAYEELKTTTDVSLLLDVLSHRVEKQATKRLHAVRPEAAEATRRRLLHTIVQRRRYLRQKTQTKREIEEHVENRKTSRIPKETVSESVPSACRSVAPSTASKPVVPLTASGPVTVSTASEFFSPSLAAAGASSDHVFLSVEDLKLEDPPVNLNIQRHDLFRNDSPVPQEKLATEKMFSVSQKQFMAANDSSPPREQYGTKDDSSVHRELPTESDFPLVPIEKNSSSSQDIISDSDSSGPQKQICVKSASALLQEHCSHERDSLSLQQHTCDSPALQAKLATNSAPSQEPMLVKCVVKKALCQGPVDSSKPQHQIVCDGLEPKQLTQSDASKPHELDPDASSAPQSQIPRNFSTPAMQLQINTESQDELTIRRKSSDGTEGTAELEDAEPRTAFNSNLVSTLGDLQHLKSFAGGQHGASAQKEKPVKKPETSCEPQAQSSGASCQQQSKHSGPGHDDLDDITPKEMVIVVSDEDDVEVIPTLQQSNHPGSTSSLVPKRAFPAVLDHFDHVVFVGDITKLKKSRAWNLTKVTFFSAVAGLKNKAEVLKVMKKHLPMRTLWLFLADLSIVAQKVPAGENICKLSSCPKAETSSLPQYRLLEGDIKAAVASKILEYESTLEDFRKDLPTFAAVMLLPIEPIWLFSMEKINEHIALHSLHDSSKDIFFVVKGAVDIQKAFETFKASWCSIAAKYKTNAKLTELLKRYEDDCGGNPVHVSDSLTQISKTTHRKQAWLDLLGSVVDLSIVRPEKKPAAANKRVSPSTPIAFPPPKKAKMTSVLSASDSSVTGSPSVIAGRPLSSSSSTTKTNPAFSACSGESSGKYQNAALLPRTDFPEVGGGATGTPVYLSNIKEDISVLLLKRVLEACGILSGYKLEINKRGYGCIATTMWRDSELVPSVLRLLSCLVIDKHNISVYSPGVSITGEVLCVVPLVQVRCSVWFHLCRWGIVCGSTCAEKQFTVNELVIKSKIETILSAAKKSVDWVLPKSYRSDKATEQIKEKDSSAKNVCLKSDSSRRQSSSTRRHRSRSNSLRRRRSRSNSLRRRRSRSNSLRHRRSRSNSSRRRRSRSNSLRRRRSRSNSLRRRRSRSNSLRRRRSRSNSLRRRRSRSFSRQRNNWSPRSRFPMIRNSRSPDLRTSISRNRNFPRSPPRKRAKNHLDMDSLVVRKPTNQQDKFWHQSRGQLRNALPPRERSSSSTRIKSPSSLRTRVPAGGVMSAEVSEYSVVVSSEGKTLTKFFVTELQKVFQGTKPPQLRNGVGWLLHTGSAHLTQVFAMLVDGLRLLDTKLTARVITFEGEACVLHYVQLTQVTEEQLASYRRLLEACVQEYDNRSAALTSETVGRCIDVFSYRTEKCTVRNCLRMRCSHYHDLSERRRDLRKHFYRDVMCNAVVTGKKCIYRMACRYCHTEEELLLHPSNFLRTVCTLPAVNGVCTSTDFCKNSHPGSPDFFFHASWKDVYVAGLEKSLLYFAGAVRNLFRVHGLAGPQSNLPVAPRILFVTPDEGVAQRAHDLVVPIAERHSLRLAPTHSLEGEIVIGCPGLLLANVKKMKSKLPFAKLAAIIVDDISCLMLPRGDASFRWLTEQLIASPFVMPSQVNKVAVCSEVRMLEVERAQTMLAACFIVGGGEPSPTSVANQPLPKQSTSTTSPGSNANTKSVGPDGRTVGEIAEGGRACPVSTDPRLGVAVLRESTPNSSYSTGRNTDVINTIRNTKCDAGGTRALVEGTPAGHVPAAPLTTNAITRSGVLESTTSSTSIALRPTDSVPTKETLASDFYLEKRKLIKDLEIRYDGYVEKPDTHPQYTIVLAAFQCEETNITWEERWLQELRVFRLDEYKAGLVKLVRKYKDLAMQLRNVSSPSVDVQSPDQLPAGGASSTVGSIWRSGTATISEKPMGRQDNCHTKSNILNDPRRRHQGRHVADYRVSAHSEPSSRASESHNRDYPRVTGDDYELRPLRTLQPAIDHDEQPSLPGRSGEAYVRRTSLRGPGPSVPQEAAPVNTVRSNEVRLSSQHPTQTFSQGPTPTVFTSQSPALSQSSAPNISGNAATTFSQGPATTWSQGTAPSDRDVAAQEQLYTVEPIYNLLLKLSPCLDAVAPVLCAMIAVARKRGSNTTAAFKLFTDPEIVKLLNMCIEKFSAESDSTADVDKRKELLFGIKGAQFLLNYAKQLSSS
ncbi:hypothetical protein FHG87_015224 [Trinorchestia longiramus]|nr:hypothetical protein FHG87_015224 [Trinorchestia longiramus]